MGSDLEKSFKNNYRDSGHWGSGVRAWVTGAVVYLHPDSSDMDILPHLLCHSLTQIFSLPPLSLYIYIYIFFPEMFENCGE